MENFEYYENNLRINEIMEVETAKRIDRSLLMHFHSSSGASNTTIILKRQCYGLYLVEPLVFLIQRVYFDV